MITVALGSIAVLGAFVASKWPTREQGSLVLVSGRIFLPANHYLDYRFSTYEGSTDLSVTGSFAVTEGGTRGIEVFVMSQADFSSWTSGYSPASYFDSGILISGTISVSLPDGADEYHLVYSNSFTNATTVETTAILYYRA